MRRLAPLILAALPFAGAVAAQDAATLMGNGKLAVISRKVGKLIAKADNRAGAMAKAA